jgi:small conductance mechanosensitive channel
MFAQSVSDACGFDPGVVCEIVFRISSNESAARTADSFLAKPAKVLFMFFLAWVAARLARRAIHRTTERWVAKQEMKQADVGPGAEQDGILAATRRHILHDTSKAERSKQRVRTLSDVLESLASIVIYVIAAMVALSEFSVSLGPFLASAGIVGVALGFGAQSLVKDFLSGIFMILEDQYGVGDVIDAGDATGVVEEVRLRTTQLRDVNGTLWYIPNGEIRRVANKSQAWARTVLDVEVAYDTDLEHAMGTIKRVADELWEENDEEATILEEPQILGVESFGADAIAIRLVVKVEPAEQWTTARELRKRLKLAFDAEGIEIPFPQRTVWVRNQPAGTTPFEAPPGQSSGGVDRDADGA